MKKELLLKWLQATPAEEVGFYNSNNEPLEVNEAWDGGKGEYLICLKPMTPVLTVLS